MRRRVIVKSSSDGVEFRAHVLPADPSQGTSCTSPANQLSRHAPAASSSATGSRPDRQVRVQVSGSDAVELEAPAYERLLVLPHPLRPSALHLDRPVIHCASSDPSCQALNLLRTGRVHAPVTAPLRIDRAVNGTPCLLRVRGRCADQLALVQP